MNEYLNRQETIAEICKERCGVHHYMCNGNPKCNIVATLAKMNPNNQVVSHSAYEQVAWERDLAIRQLQDIGKGLGERMDDIKSIINNKSELMNGEQ